MAYRSIASNVVKDTTLTITKPTGTASGDILVFVICNDSNTTPAPSWPTGFVEITGSPQHSTADGMYFSAAIKVAGGSEPANYTVTVATAHIGAIVALSACNNTGVPYRSSVGVNSSANASPWSAVSAAFGSVTALVCDFVFLMGSDVTAAAAVVGTAPSGFTKRADLNDSGPGFLNIMVATQDSVASGATGALTGIGTAAGKSAGWGCFAIALDLTSQPPAGAGVVPFNRNISSGGMREFSGGIRAYHRRHQIVVPLLPKGWQRRASGLCVRV
jgi:hypothetical protein